MSTQSRARSRHVVSLRVRYDLRTGAFTYPAFILVTPDNFIENPIGKVLQKRLRAVAAPTQLSVIEGGRPNG